MNTDDHGFYRKRIEQTRATGITAQERDRLLTRFTQERTSFADCCGFLRIVADCRGFDAEEVDRLLTELTADRRLEI